MKRYDDPVQYPREMAAVVVGSWGDDFSPLWKGVLYRLLPSMTGGRPVRLRRAECEHQHRQKRKAIECAERLAILDGAPRV